MADELKFNRREVISKGLSLGLIAGGTVILGKPDFLLAKTKPAGIPDLVAVKNGEPDTMFKKAIELMGGMNQFVKKGQTVKAFEDAAFSQEVNKIGPVVTTEFGHHIIQVLGRSPGKVVKLDEVRDKIAMHLEQQKQQAIFTEMTARLRKNAAIKYYEN